MKAKPFDRDTAINQEGRARTDPGIGPSDSSDSVNDLPQEQQDADSDRRFTGERATVENRPDVASGEDVGVDKEVSEEDAGVSRAPPDPTRNGGTPG